MDSPEKRRVDAYMDTISRIEPDIAMIDIGAAAASISISLKRIAQAQESVADSCVKIRYILLIGLVLLGGLSGAVVAYLLRN